MSQEKLSDQHINKKWDDFTVDLQVAQETLRINLNDNKNNTCLRLSTLMINCLANYKNTTIQ